MENKDIKNLLINLSVTAVVISVVLGVLFIWFKSSSYKSDKECENSIIIDSSYLNDYKLVESQDSNIDTTKEEKEVQSNLEDSEINTDTVTDSDNEYNYEDMYIYEEVNSEEDCNDSNLGNNNYNVSEYDEMLLLKIGTQEAGNQSVTCIASVMQTVINRVNDSRFANTIEGVLFSPGQFSGADILMAVEPYDITYEALELVKSGYDNGGALYFESIGYGWHMDNLEFLYQDGDMYFYR